MQTDFNDVTIDSPDGYYEYHLSTPMKAIASVALIFNTYGLISLDYEYVDYASAKFNVEDYDFNDENNIKEIIKNYKFKDCILNKEKLIKKLNYVNIISKNINLF